MRVARPPTLIAMSRANNLTLAAVERLRSRASRALARNDWEQAAYWEERVLLAEERVWRRLGVPQPSTTVRPQRPRWRSDLR